ncbi:MAG: translation initiation factor IF-3 [Oscillospiraceae bacterium]|nr:translation initiation factor IF-3 [Oscillospiraceae bacterium]
MSKLAHQINEDIRDKEVRLIAEDGEQLGVMPTQAALDIAYEKDLDLVKISPGAKPPVCKVMDYGKYKFEQSKREKEAKRNQHVVEIKEIRMSPVIDTNDFNVKLRNGHKFLKEGDRLKVTVRFRGRQMAHTEIGRGVLERYAAACEEIAVLDKNPKLEGRNMSMFLSPRAQKPEKAKPAPAAETAAEEQATTEGATENA